MFRLSYHENSPYEALAVSGITYGDGSLVTFPKYDYGEAKMFDQQLGVSQCASSQDETTVSVANHPAN